MACEISVEVKEGYLHLRVAGENTVENVHHYLAATIAACLTHKISSVLIEENLSGPSLDVLEIYRIAASESQSAAPAVQRVAYVDMNPEHIAARMNFAAAVASEHGMDIRFFLAVDRAEDWMRGEIRADKRRPG